MCVKDSEVADGFTHFISLTEQHAEFAVFINSVMNVGFNPAALVSFLVTSGLFQSLLLGYPSDVH